MDLSRKPQHRTPGAFNEEIPYYIFNEKRPAFAEISLNHKEKIAPILSQNHYTKKCSLLQTKGAFSAPLLGGFSQNMESFPARTILLHFSLYHTLLKIR